MTTMIETPRPTGGDEPVALPAPRGRTSAALLRLLSGAPGRAVGDRDLIWSGTIEDALVDDDLQLALWLTYELHYRGLAGVAEDWEWQPELLRVRQRWESLLLAALHQRLAAAAGADASAPDDLPRTLRELADRDVTPSLSQYLMRDATAEQFTEFLIHRSIYHLKEADPHSWGIPRLSGPAKAALLTIQLDEYGSGHLDAMHAQLFRELMVDWQLEARYGAYLDRVPGTTLLATNVISHFGLHRRWRGALVGHLAMFEMTSSTPNGRYARAHRRLGHADASARFFDEHVVADAAHEQIAAHRLAAGLGRQEPGLVDDVIFGARVAALVDELTAGLLVNAWRAGRGSLRDAETG